MLTRSLIREIFLQSEKNNSDQALFYRLIRSIAINRTNREKETR